MQIQPYFPAKKLRKIRALKIRMRQLFFKKYKVNNDLRIKEQETQTSFIADLFRRSKFDIFKKYDACAEGPP